MDNLTMSFREGYVLILQSVFKARGLTFEQGRKFNMDCERAGRKLRKKIGIKAPAGQFYISDRYQKKWAGSMGLI